MSLTNSNNDEITSKLQEIVTELRFLVNAVDREVSHMKIETKEDINDLKNAVTNIEKKIEDYQKENRTIPFQVKLLWSAMVMVIGILIGAILTEISATYVKSNAPIPVQSQPNMTKPPMINAPFKR